ncbi:oxidoreductase [Lithospermum erythrorhizon]|uniref:Oxidoreductase n=1 Tax=Lithospermum erythrorhizon TaxID=34254 RepID=A0AAV3QJG2_LITER
MQEAIPYRRWATNQNNSSSSTSSTIYLKGPEGHDLKRIVEETPVLIFMKSGDCMGHVVKRLLQGLGVNPCVYEIDDKDEKRICVEIMGIIDGGGGRDGEGVQFPVAFIGGELFGGLDRVMATHITGELNLVLKQAGALWL